MTQVSGDLCSTILGFQVGPGVEHWGAAGTPATVVAKGCQGPSATPRELEDVCVNGTAHPSPRGGWNKEVGACVLLERSLPTVSSCPVNL